MPGLPHEDGILRSIRGADGQTIVSFKRGAAFEFLRILAKQDQAFARKIESMYSVETNPDGPWRYDLADGERDKLAALLEAAEATGETSAGCEAILEALRAEHAGHRHQRAD